MPKIVLNKRTFNIENLDKIFFPKTKITKGNLIEYYEKNSKIIIPHCKDRALVMHRFPSGIEGNSFYQKNASDYFPSWIKTIEIENRTIEGENRFVICNDTATLVYIANQGCITPHMWLSKIDKLEYPDTLIFDLDPSSDDPKEFKMICEVALLLKEILSDFELNSFVMTTGSHGLHVRVPLKQEVTFEESRNFARAIGEIAIKQVPTKITLESRKEKRKNKILIDIMRNSFGATAVMPYAVRAKEGAPIATPIEWKEVKSKTLRAQKYNIKNIFRRLNEKGDIWKNMKKSQGSIKKALKYYKQ